MDKVYIEGKQLKGENYAESGFITGEYDNCTFSNCIFSNTDLSAVDFSDCVFSDCDLSMATLKDTAFRDVKFKNCKLLGLHFNDCNPFLLSFDFEACILNFSSFYRLKIKNTRFEDCKMEEVDLVETDLTNALFQHCDLREAVFDNTILDGADLTTAFHFSIDPEMNQIYRAKFSMQNVAGLLHKYKIIIT